MLDILFSVIGLAGFEGLRIYKLSIAGKDAIPGSLVTYICALCLIAAFVCAVTYAMELNSLLKSIFLGFSIPSSGKAVFERVEKPKPEVDIPNAQVDDIQVTVNPLDDDNKSDDVFGINPLQWLVYYFSR